jgi:glycosyltransferase involved in cell wall biosynthesis
MPNPMQYEIVVVDNQSDEQDTLDYLRELDELSNITVIKYDKPFNFSAINNIALGYAKGDMLCFVNDDVEVIGSDWLWYPDDRLRHGGVILGIGGAVTP